MIGSPTDSTGFAGLANALAGHYTVVTYDPRGIGNGSEDTSRNVTPEQQADDVHRLLSALGDEPAYVFGSSGGAIAGLALVTSRPCQMRTLVDHEPPVVELLPDRAQVRAKIEDIYDTYRADGRTRRRRDSWPVPAWTVYPVRRQTRRVGNLLRRRDPDARRHRALPRAPAPPGHALPARHQGTAGGIGASWSPAGPRRRGRSPSVPL
jgi:pimeloyl-ACP methyl ester carboxylesterase